MMLFGNVVLVREITYTGHDEMPCRVSTELIIVACDFFWQRLNAGKPPTLTYLTATGFMHRKMEEAGMGTFAYYSNSQIDT